MQVSTLLVTPSREFGEILRRALQESLDVRIEIAKNADEAISRAQEDLFYIGILDATLDDPQLAELTGRLRQITPGIGIFVIPSETDPPTVDYSIIEPVATLARPFVLPELVMKIDSYINTLSEETTPVSTGETTTEQVSDSDVLPWLADATMAARYLTQLSLDTDAHGTLITYRDQLWAYTGQLPQPAAEELTRMVAQHWKIKSGSDLARFIHLDAADAEVMLFATDVSDGFILALVYSAGIPFSTIRTQSTQLAKKLQQPPDAVLEMETAAFPDMTRGGEQTAAEIDVKDMLTDIASEWRPVQDQEERHPELLSDLLADQVPAEDPQIPLKLEREAPTEPFDTETEPFIRAREPLYVHVSQEISLQDIEDEETDPIVVQDDLSEYELSVREMPEESGEVLTDELEPTRPTEISTVAQQFGFDPVSPALFNLTYSCVIVPRFPHHYLTGQVAQKMAEWMPLFCTAYGWRLEHLAIRPQFLQWMVNVSPNTSPSEIVDTIRAQTSQRLFDNFPKVEEEAVAGDFWAPGYLIMSGRKPPPAILVNDFIHQTRIRQGYVRKP